MTTTYKSNNNSVVKTISVIITAVAAASAAVAALVGLSSSCGRSNQQLCIKKSSRTSTWYEVESNASFNEGWYHSQFCCKKSSFDKIYEKIESVWDQIHSCPCHNCVFCICHRV